MASLFGPNQNFYQPCIEDSPQEDFRNIPMSGDYISSYDISKHRSFDTDSVRRIDADQGMFLAIAPRLNAPPAMCLGLALGKFASYTVLS